MMNTSLFKPEAGGSIVVTVSLTRVYTLSLAAGPKPVSRTTSTPMGVVNAHTDAR
jgi:hypothetical protein